ncbi:hypothetical protein TruAng_000963 [Truncatella angustata]|nr:hypothetical protein TruAng_000963 [Truncatella angustata]
MIKQQAIYVGVPEGAPPPVGDPQPILTGDGSLTAMAMLAYPVAPEDWTSQYMRPTSGASTAKPSGVPLLLAPGPGSRNAAINLTAEIPTGNESSGNPDNVPQADPGMVPLGLAIHGMEMGDMAPLGAGFSPVGTIIMHDPQESTFNFDLMNVDNDFAMEPLNESRRSPVFGLQPPNQTALAVIPDRNRPATPNQDPFFDFMVNPGTANYHLIDGLIRDCNRTPTRTINPQVLRFSPAAHELADIGLDDGTSPASGDEAVEVKYQFLDFQPTSCPQLLDNDPSDAEALIRQNEPVFRPHEVRIHNLWSSRPSSRAVDTGNMITPAYRDHILRLMNPRAQAIDDTHERLRGRHPQDLSVSSSVVVARIHRQTIQHTQREDDPR